MRKRLLLLAPLVAFLAACGSNGWVATPVGDEDPPHCFLITHEWQKGGWDYTEGVGQTCVDTTSTSVSGG